ncbi:multiple epidermal growth factor-like domains protein 10, partial [Saccostrea cucullata]|uniref:multiple epidermal growth factor-like domains protein 10 n=1 Tax=Saccostrea cuccullata TaxID=36930 RepID=UPI002ED4F401
MSKLLENLKSKSEKLENNHSKAKILKKDNQEAFEIKFHPFYRNFMNNSCPDGWFGENCSERCPENQYGSLCLGICYCNPNETCDHVLGCLQKGVCTGHDGEFKCCINYYQHIKNKCEVCFPGTYGYNCEDNCPNGTYGYLCRQKCKCNSDVICDKRFGCVDQ